MQTISVIKDVGSTNKTFWQNMIDSSLESDFKSRIKRTCNIGLVSFKNLFSRGPDSAIIILLDLHNEVVCLFDQFTDYCVGG